MELAQGPQRWERKEKKTPKKKRDGRANLQGEEEINFTATEAGETPHQTEGETVAVEMIPLEKEEKEEEEGEGYKGEEEEEEEEEESQLQRHAVERTLVPGTDERGSGSESDAWLSEPDDEPGRGTFDRVQDWEWSEISQGQRRTMGIPEPDSDGEEFASSMRRRTSHRATSIWESNRSDFAADGL